MVAIWHHIRMIEFLQAGGEQCVAMTRHIWRELPKLFQWFLLAGRGETLMFGFLYYYKVWTWLKIVSCNLQIDRTWQNYKKSKNLLLWNRCPQQREQLHGAHEFSELTLPWQLLGPWQICHLQLCSSCGTIQGHDDMTEMTDCHVKFANVW